MGARLEAQAAAAAAAAAAGRAGGRAGGRRSGEAGRGEAGADEGSAEDAELRRALALSLAEQEDPELEEALRRSVDAAAGEGDWGPDETSTNGDAPAAPSAAEHRPAGELSSSAPRVGAARGAGLRGAGPGWKGVEAQLRQGNWSFTRVSGGHRVYSRWAGLLAESGASAAPQLATLASWGWTCWLPGCATRPRGVPYPAGRVRCFL